MHEALKGGFAAGVALANLHQTRDIPILSVALELVELIW